MSDVRAQEVTVLRLAGSSGTLELIGVQDQLGWKFQIRTHEGGLLDEEDAFEPPPPRPWVHTWHDALDQLGSFPWRELIPLHAEPAFRAQIVGAFLGTDTTNRDVLDHLQHALDRWAAVLASPGRFALQEPWK